MATFEIRNENGKTFGPYQGKQIVQLGQERRLYQGMEIRRLPDGAWKDIGSVREIQNYITPKPSVSSPPSLPTKKPITATVSPVEDNPIETATPPSNTTPATPQIQSDAAMGSIVAGVSSMGAYYNHKRVTSGAHSLGIAGMVLGVIGICLFWVPFVGLLLAGIGLLMGVVGIVLALTRKGTGIGFSIGASVLCVVAGLLNTPAVFVVLSAWQVAQEAIERSNPELIKEFDTVEWNALTQRRNKHVELRNAFRISNAEIFVDDSGYSKRLTLKFDVHNGTSYSIKHAYFHAKLITKGREIPWVDTDFNYSIPGGLAPDESATWILAPNRFDSDWSPAMDAKDADLHITVKNVDGPDDEYLYPQWDEDDEKHFARLQELKE